MSWVWSFQRRFQEETYILLTPGFGQTLERGGRGLSVYAIHRRKMKAPDREFVEHRPDRGRIYRSISQLPLSHVRVRAREQTEFPIVLSISIAAR